MPNSLPKQKKLVSISEAAKILGVSIDTVRRWDNSGVLHSERPDGKNRYFSLDELEKHKSTQPLSISEAAKELHISPTTLRRLEAKGIFEPKRNNAGERVYDRDSIEKFLSSDYFLRKKQIVKKDFSEDDIAPKKTQGIETRNSGETYSNPPSKSSNRMPEIIAAVLIFALLTAIGATNIALSEIKSIRTSQSSVVLSATVMHEEMKETSIPEITSTEIEETVAETTEEPVSLESIQSLIDGVSDFASEEATGAAKKTDEERGGTDLNDLRIILSIKTGGAEFINIREKPSTESGKIDKAREGDTFEMVSRDSDWYEIRLADKSNGFILEKFAQIKEIK